MRQHARSAVTRRDVRLAAIRRLTLWIAGGAAAATVGLGTAFAHALPGHAGSSAAPAAGTNSAPATPGQSAVHRSTEHHRGAHHHQRDALTAPTRSPAPAPPASTHAPVTSGGS
jgi:hypothetical protein